MTSINADIEAIVAKHYKTGTKMFAAITPELVTFIEGLVAERTAALEAEVATLKAAVHSVASKVVGERKKSVVPPKGKEMRLRLAPNTLVFKTCGENIGKASEVSTTYTAKYVEKTGTRDGAEVTFGVLETVLDGKECSFFTPTAWSIAVAESFTKATGIAASTKREGYGACYVRPTGKASKTGKMLLEAVKRLEEDDSEPIIKAEMWGATSSFDLVEKKAAVAAPAVAVAKPKKLKGADKVVEEALILAPAEGLVAPKKVAKAPTVVKAAPTVAPKPPADEDSDTDEDDDDASSTGSAVEETDASGSDSD